MAASSSSGDDLNLTMDKIREKATTISSWADLIKASKINMMEKKIYLDAEEREQLRNSLEILQRSKKVMSTREIFEQLQDLAPNKCAMKFVPSSNPSSAFLTTDIFCVEIKSPSEESPLVDEVYVVHGNHKPTEQARFMKKLINQARWEELVTELNGLNRFYPNDMHGKVETSKKQETFKSLLVIEKDLLSLQPSLQSVGIENLYDFLECPVGLIRQREAGQPMTLSYFLSPYELIDVRLGKMISLSHEDIFERYMGSFAEIAVKNCPHGCALPAKSLRRKSKSGFSEINSENSNYLPATFTLEFKRALLLPKKTVAEIENISGNEISTVGDGGNLLKWIIEEKGSCGTVSASKGLPVTLKGQTDRYIIDSIAHQHLAAQKVSKIPFSHPNQVISAVRVLRKQLLMNTVIGSCVRRCDDTSTKHPAGLKFQLSFPSRESAECLFEHPLAQEQILIGIARFKFANFKLLSVQLEAVFGASSELGLKNVSDIASKVFQKSWSIPVTMRSVVTQLGWRPKSNWSGQHEEPMDTSDGGQPDRSGSDGGGKGSRDDWMKRLSGRDKFFLSGRTDSPDSEGKVSKAWCPNYNSNLYSSHMSRSAQTEKIVYTVEPIGNPNRPPNLLDLFKEIDVVEELIPPRPNQQHLKSPTPLPMTPQSTKLQEMLGTPAVGSFPLPPSHGLQTGSQANQSMGMARPVPRGRHLSSSSDTFGELESILQMSKSLSSEPHQQMAFGSSTESASCTPVGLEAGPSRQIRRTGSVQDGAEHVFGDIGSMSPSSGSQGEPSPILPGSSAGMPMIPPAVPPHSPHVSQPMTPSSIFPPNPRFMHSRSFDLGMLPPSTPGHPGFGIPGLPRPLSSTGRGIDEFDFEKSDPVETGMFGAPKYRIMSDSTESGGSMSASPYFAGASQAAFPFGQLPASGPGSRGGKIPRGGGSRARRSKKLPGNVGDKPFPTDLAAAAAAVGTTGTKKRGGTGTRRARKPRGGSIQPPNTLSASQMIVNESHISVATVTEPNMEQQQFQKMLPAATTSSIFPNMTSPNICDPNFIKLGASFPDPFAPPPEKSKGSTSGPIGLEIEDSDDSDSQSGDAHLRRQIQDVLSSAGPKPSPDHQGGKSATQPQPAEGKRTPGSGNLFENIQTVGTQPALAGVHPQPPPPPPPPPLPPPAPTIPRPKPNILAKNVSIRKGSLDMVIGKLRDKIGGTQYPAEGVSDDESSVGESAERKAKSVTSTGSTESVTDNVFMAHPTTELVQQQSLQQERKILELEPSGSTASPSDSEGIKVVIKKTLIKQCQEKMTLPVATAKQAISKQKSTEGKTTKGAAKDEPKTRPKEKKKKEDKFAALKAEVFSKKRKMEDGTGGKQTYAKTEKQMLSPGVKVPKILQQEVQTASATPAALDPKFPGSEGIFFSKSLKGFKIPKLQEETPAVSAPQPSPTKQAPSSQKRTSDTNTTASAAQNKPKSATKHVSSKPPNLQPEVLTNFRPIGRKSLLPKPGDDFSDASTFKEEHRSAVTDTPAEPSWDNSIRSPDPDSGFVIDERSPIGLNISKDSDMSPELSIDTEIDNTDI